MILLVGYMPDAGPRPAAPEGVFWQTYGGSGSVPQSSVPTSTGGTPRAMGAIVRRRAPILIVSSHAGTQDAFVALLRDLRTPALGVDSVEQACTLLEHQAVRAALLHVVHAADWENCRRLRELLPPVSPVLVLSERTQAGGEYRQRARRMGCSAFVARRCAPQAVVSAIHRATSGEPWTEYVGGL